MSDDLLRCADLINRMAEVEHILRLPKNMLTKQEQHHNVTAFKVPDPLTPDEMWELANKLSIPADFRPGVDRTSHAVHEYNDPDHRVVMVLYAGDLPIAFVPSPLRDVHKHNVNLINRYMASHDVMSTPKQLLNVVHVRIILFPSVDLLRAAEEAYTKVNK